MTDVMRGRPGKANADAGGGNRALAIRSYVATQNGMGRSDAEDERTRGEPEFFPGNRRAEHGETIVVTKNGRPVARITPQRRDRADDPEWRDRFEALTESLRSKRGSGRPVGTIGEDVIYGDDPP